MKKFSKLLLILLTLVCFTNVKAETLTEDSTDKSSDATLKDVVINSEKVVCTDYVCEQIIENNDINKVVITYKTNDEKASVSEEKLEKDLNEGLNEFKVVVTAEDGTTKDYTFKITKKVLSTDSSLKKITVNGTEVTLKTGVVKYNVDVSYASKKIEIAVEPNSSKAKVEGFTANKISYDFFDDKKEVKIKVISEAGDITTYVLNITKREEKDATLKNLTIKNAKINFESGVFDYEITVLKNIDKLEIETVTTDSDANVSIDGADKLEFGENTVTITVENDENIKTYTIKVKRLESEDNTLANLKSLEIEKYSLDFQEDKYEYDLKIGDDNYLVIKALPKIDTGKVEVTGNLDLVNGSIIKIKVYYDDETFNVYKINIIKEENVQKDNKINKIVIIIVIALILIAIIVLVIIQIKNKKNNSSKGNKSKKEDMKVKKETLISISDDEEIEDII